MKPVNAEENPGLAKLPTEVRNKMGYMKNGGSIKMAKGGVTRADGCVMKGHTKGKMIKMKSGGYC
jgi:hypothetical protein